ncbi:MAG TPA: hypothetical protein VIL71_13280 [Spirillospora sp.]
MACTRPIDLKLIEEYSKVLIQAAVVTSEAAEIVRRIAPIISTKLRALAEADPGNEICVVLDIAWRSLYLIGGPLNGVSTDPVIVLRERREDAVKLAVAVQRLLNTKAAVK